MYKFSCQIIDAYDDVYGEYLTKFASERPNTYVMTPDEKSRLGDDDYALCYITKTASKMPKFPINNFDNTWLSNKMFPETFHKLSSEAAGTAAHFIKKACERFGIIPNDQLETMEKVAEHNLVFETQEKPEEVKVASTPDLSAFADVKRIGDSYTHAQYVFATPAHVKLGAKYFEEKHDKILDSEDRFKYASALQIRAEELGMSPLKGAISKYASDSYNAHLNAHLSSRRQMLYGRDELLGEFNKISSVVSKYTPPQFAQILHGFDKKAGLTQYYGGYLTDPYVATFSQQADKTAHVRWRDKTGSRNLTDEEINAVVGGMNEKIAEHFGNALANEMKKDPVAIFNSLPNDAKEIIANIHDGLL